MLLGHDSIEDAAYVGIDDSLGGQIPTAFVALKEGQTATTEELAIFCRQNLADFKLPKRIAFDIKELSIVFSVNKPPFTTDNATSLCYFEDISNLSSR